MRAMPQSVRRPPKTVEDYLALPDDVRAELVDGELVTTPAPRLDHQDAAALLWMAIHRHVTPQELGRAYIAPVDVHLPSGCIVKPDVCFVRTEHLDIATDCIRGVPDLAVEVVSPFGEAYDRITKRALYARNGISTYWIADPAERSIETLTLRAGAYQPAGWFEGDAVLATPLFPGIRLPLPDVFR